MKRILLLIGILVLFPLDCFAQGGVRFGDDATVYTVQVPFGPVLSVSNAVISFCTAPAINVPCTNKATTYTDATLTTACPTSTQIVLASTNTCTGTTDLYGRWGVWVAAGQYAYTVQFTDGSGGIATYGPIPVTAGGSSGGGVGSVTGTPNQVDSSGGANPIISLDPNILLPGSLTVTAGAISASGGGSINATAIDGVTVTGSPITSQCPVATSATTAVWAACGTGGGGSNPTTNGITRWNGSWATSINDVAALTGQPLYATNGLPAAFLSPGVLDGNGGSPVTTAGYTIKCDSATTLLDRVHVLRFQSGASSPTVPLSTASGCTGGFSVTVIDDGAGTLVFGHTGSDTFSIFNGSTATDGATSFTLTNGEYATLTQGATGLWEVRIVPPVGSPPFSAITTATNTSATMTCGSGCSILPSTGSISANDFQFGSSAIALGNTLPTSGQCLGYNGTIILGVTCGTPAFSGITSGTNTAAAMLVGTGASIGPTGSGVVDANNLQFTAAELPLGAAPTSGQCLEYNGTVITGAACSGGGGGATWTNLSPATANNSPVNNGNFNTTQGCTLTGATDCFDFTESAASTGTGAQIGITTIGNSTSSGLSLTGTIPSAANPGTNGNNLFPFTTTPGGNASSGTNAGGNAGNWPITLSNGGNGSGVAPAGNASRITITGGAPGSTGANGLPGIFSGIDFTIPGLSSGNGAFGTIGQAITQIVGNGTTAVITCNVLGGTNCSGQTVGGQINIVGNSVSGFNGLQVISANGSGTISFLSSTNSTGTGGYYTGGGQSALGDVLTFTNTQPATGVGGFRPGTPTTDQCAFVWAGSTASSQKFCFEINARPSTNGANPIMSVNFGFPLNPSTNNTALWGLQAGGSVAVNRVIYEQAESVNGAFQVGGLEQINGPVVVSGHQNESTLGPIKFGLPASGVLKSRISLTGGSNDSLTGVLSIGCNQSDCVGLTNNSGSTIAKGTPVKMSSSNETVTPTVVADATTPPNVIGINMFSCLNNAVCTVGTWGLAKGVGTIGTGSCTLGQDVVIDSTTPGDIKCVTAGSGANGGTIGIAASTSSPIDIIIRPR